MALDRWRRGAWVPLGALAVGALASIGPWQGRLSRPIGDALQRLLAPTQPPAGVLVVDVDDASVAALGARLGPWPFKRDVHALAIEHLRELGASAVVLNLLMIEPGDGDAALARVLARPGAPVVLAAAGLYPPGEAPAAAQWPGGPTVPAVAWPAIVQPAASLWPAPGQPPRMGIATTPIDSDGVLRSLPLWHEAAGRRWPSLALAAWQAQAGTAADAAAAGAAATAGDWPLDRAGRVGLLVPGPAGRPPVVPFERLWRSALGGPQDPALAQAVRGSVVFAGSTALAAGRVMTVNGQRDGTELQALAYAALHDGTMLRPAPGAVQALLLLLAAGPAIAAWRGRAAAPGRALSLAAAAAAGLAVLDAGLLAAWRIDLDLAAPLL
ncbi:MAG: CHASE2 domain-containing protein, partial [Burkholderiaceae bacterium]|nr:CHASE2 domain-containing protein [Burkholderiaceae bacterium]